MSRWLASGRHSLCLVIALASNLFGQYGFRVWTVDDGLPQNSIRDILQTRDSYLWLATADGLVRFDGLRFVTFNRSNSPGMINNRALALYEDREGGVWVGSDGSVSRFHDGVFTGYGAESGLPSGWVRGIASHPSGDVLVLFTERVLRWRNGRFESVDTEPFPNNFLIDFPVTRYLPRTGFWSHSPNGLAAYIDGKVRFWDSHQGNPGSELRAVAEDEEGQLWTGGRGQLFRDRNGQLMAAPLPPECSPSEDIVFVAAPKLKLVCRGPTSTLIISTLDLREQQKISNSPLPVTQPLSRMVWREDREGNFWIGVDGGGLWRLRKQPITTLSGGQGLRDHNVYPIYEDRSGAIWIAAWPNTLNRYHHGKLQHFTGKDGVVPYISALHEDRSGRLWVGAYSSNADGLRVFQNGRFAVPPPALRNLGLVHAILEDRHGSLWFGCEDKLVRYHNGVTTIFTTRNGLATNYANVLVEDPAGNLWIGGHGGVTRLSNGRFTSYTVRDGLPSPMVRTLYMDADNVLWIGTYDGGLGRFDGTKFTHYTTREGLFSNGVFQILDDAQGRLWMSSNQGIYRVKKQQLNDFAAGKISAINSTAYGKGDGMLNIECNGGHWPAGIRARDGKLWFPTQDGAAVVDADKVAANPDSPSVLIESFLVDRKLVPVNRPVELQPAQNSFEIQYTAISFGDAERIQFKYKLAGLDEDWIDAGTRRTAYYSHVPSGTYTFQVIAANADDVWSDSGKSLAVIVLPHFYQTWWFVTLAGTATCAVVFLTAHSRLSRLKQAQAAQQAFSRQLIASQEGERKRIAAELHDSLGQRLVIIKNLALLLLQPRNGAPVLDKLQHERIEEISAEVSGAVHEVREISYNLRPYRLDRLGLTEALQAMIEMASSASATTFVAEIDNIDGVFPKEAEINFYRIVQECVNNILKHANADRATVRIRKIQERVILTVSDNGRGFAPDSSHLHTALGGFGLTGISERAQLLGGKAAIQSAPGQGTTVTIDIDVRRVNDGR